MSYIPKTTSLGPRNPQGTQADDSEHHTCMCVSTCTHTCMHKENIFKGSNRYGRKAREMK